MRAKSMTLTGWGRSCESTADVFRPEKFADIGKALASDNLMLARGEGRSYGDTALNGDASVLLMTRMDRLLSFDDQTGILVCEPGVTLRDLMRSFVPKGWMPCVSPGTSYATVGGCLANDVHGKNHEAEGSFGDHVLWFDLALGPDNQQRIEPGHPLFEATIGGLGLTGVVTRIAMKLKKCPSNAVDVSERRISNLEAFLEGFEECRHTAGYSVGWIDGLAKGTSLGRGILETAEMSATSVATPALKQKKVPFDFPGIALNKLSISAFNALYYRRIPDSGRMSQKHLETFFYPLDAIDQWNRIYGKRGFYQFQCVLPDAESPQGLKTLLETISAAGSASFLAVLKTLGGEGRGHLSFPMKGYTLALDFPKSSDSTALMKRLESITHDHGGRIYFAKDSTLDADMVDRMYPRARAFRETLNAFPETARFSSDMARRLRLNPDRGAQNG